MKNQNLQPLSEKELNFFASLTIDECEEYRRIKHPDYLILKHDEEQINLGNISAEKKMNQLLKLKHIHWCCPYPEDAKQQLAIINGEDCSNCLV